MPRWQIAFTLVLAISGIAVAGVLFHAAGWQFGLGFTCGALFLAGMVRWRYGFWPEA